ncbi:MAG: hypothetical protein ACI4RO_00345, partial [Candidatus Scatosoma sp.]
RKDERLCFFAIESAKETIFMLCCVCKKKRAEKICGKITDGKEERAYYCSDCYRRLFKNAVRTTDADGPGQGKKAETKAPFQAGHSEVRADKKQARCPFCGTFAADYESTRLFGCPECYRYLFDYVKESVFLMQGGEPHAGKKPQDFSGKGLRTAAESAGAAARMKDKGRV